MTFVILYSIRVPFHGVNESIVDYFTLAFNRSILHVQSLVKIALQIGFFLECHRSLG